MLPSVAALHQIVLRFTGEKVVVCGALAEAGGRFAETGGSAWDQWGRGTLCLKAYRSNPVYHCTRTHTHTPTRVMPPGQRGSDNACA